MQPAFENIYHFKHKVTGAEFSASWNVTDGGQTNYSGPSDDYQFTHAELNVQAGELTDGQALALGTDHAQLPAFITQAPVRVTAL